MLGLSCLNALQDRKSRYYCIISLFGHEINFCGWNCSLFCFNVYTLLGSRRQNTLRVAVLLVIMFVTARSVIMVTPGRLPSKA